MRRCVRLVSRISSGGALVQLVGWQGGERGTKGRKISAEELSWFLESGRQQQKERVVGSSKRRRQKRTDLLLTCFRARKQKHMSNRSIRLTPPPASISPYTPLFSLAPPQIYCLMDVRGWKHREVRAFFFFRIFVVARRDYFVFFCCSFLFLVS